MHRGVPFNLKAADGDEYQVPHPDYIFLPTRSADKRTYVMVHNDDNQAAHRIPANARDPVKNLIQISNAYLADDPKG